MFTVLWADSRRVNTSSLDISREKKAAWALLVLGGAQQPVEGQGGLADAGAGGQDDQVAGLEALGDGVQAAEADPEARWSRGPPGGPAAPPWRPGPRRRCAPGPCARWPWARRNRSTAGLLHQGVGRRLLLGGLAHQLGAQADQLAQLALAHQQVGQHLGPAHLLGAEQLHQPGVAAHPGQVPGLVQGVLEGEGVDLHLGFHQRLQGLEHRPVGRVDEVVLAEGEDISVAASSAPGGAAGGQQGAFSLDVFGKTFGKPFVHGSRAGVGCSRCRSHVHEDRVGDGDGVDAPH